MKKFNIGGTNWGINKPLKKVLKKLIKQNIAKPHRKDAMEILNKCADKTIREFLFFALSNKANLACTCLDFAVYKKNGKRIKNESFGNLPE